MFLVGVAQLERQLLLDLLERVLHRHGVRVAMSALHAEVGRLLLALLAHLFDIHFLGRLEVGLRVQLGVHGLPAVLEGLHRGVDAFLLLQEFRLARRFLH